MNASGPAGAAPSRIERGATIGVVLVLTLLVWGLFAPDRGFLQDELWSLASVRSRANPLDQVLWPGNTFALTPQRALAGLPYALAVWSGRPRLGLQLVYGLSWLAAALLAATIARVALPGRPWLAFAAAALTASATGDLSFNNLSFVGAHLSAALYLAALASFLAFAREGRPVPLTAAALGLTLSVWMYDGAAIVALATPLLTPLLAGRSPRRRSLAGALVWYAVLAPYLAVFTWSVRQARSYAGQLVQPPRAGELAARAWRYFASNFSPWSWAGYFQRPEDPTVPRALPPAWHMGLTLAGLAAFAGVAVWLWRRQAAGARANAGGPGGARRLLEFGLGVVALAFLAVVGFAALKQAPMTYRSQVLSRVFASLLIATACDALGLFTRRLAAALPLAALGVGFGTHAGLESQDFHLSLWRRHRDELRSIVGQVPALSEPLPGGEPPRLLLYAPGGAPFLATHYPEVGRPWLNYLYEKRVRLAPWNVAARRYACLAQPGRFVCRDAALEACYATGACRPDELPFDRTVLLTYSLEERRYVLRHELPPDLTGGLDGVGYAPLAHIVPGPRTRTMRELLDAPELLASFFPERRTDGRARGPSRAKGE